MPLFQTKTPTVFMAIPLDGNCRHFTFSSMEQYAERYEKIRHVCEEVEIDLYDEGFPGAAQLWKAYSTRFSISQMPEWYDTVEGLEEHQKAALYHCLMYKGVDDLDEAMTWLREDMPTMVEGDTKEFAMAMADDQGDDFYTSDLAKRCFDYEQFGRDLGFDLEEDDGLRDEERGEQWVDDMGGIERLDVETRKRYLDWDCIARELDTGGDVVEFRFAGKTWTIWSD